MSKVKILAECGINHNGDFNILKKLIDGAIESGADIVKFQKRTVEKVYSKEFLESPRNDGNMYGWKTQGDQKRGIELSKDTYDWINEYCNGKIEWTASCWDTESQLFLRQYNLKYNKLASCLITNFELVEMIAQEGKHTFISTGMSNWEEIDNVVDIFRKYNCPFSLLHCVSTYPMENHQANLLMINTLKERYGCDVGYSCHSKGRIVPLVAVGLGITCLEKHVTLDKTMYGSDQAASLEMDDFKKLIIDTRSIEKAMGTGERILSEEELAVRKKLRGV